MRRANVDEIELKKTLDDFSRYCEEVRGDWSDFDGRTLLHQWNSAHEHILQAIELDEVKK